MFDNNRPADSSGYPDIKSLWWSTSTFLTFEEALEYAEQWAPTDVIPTGWNGQPIDYSGHGDTLEIREVP